MSLINRIKAAPILPPQTLKFEHQVAGHVYVEGGKPGLLKHQNGHILKPAPVGDVRGQRELSFYQSLAREMKDPSILTLKSFVPQFHGVWTSEAGGHSYMCLQDVADQFKVPSILDVKVGKRTYDPDASEAKIQKEVSKYPMMQTLGFRILGMRVFNPATSKYDVYGKDFGKKVELDMVIAAFKTFLHDLSPSHLAARPALLCLYLHRLDSIRLWFQHQTRFNFYASSLLFIYENEQATLESLAISGESMENNRASRSESGCPTCTLPLQLCEKFFQFQHRVCNIYMIDFAHVFPSKVTETLDKNYLFGLSNLIVFLKKILASDLEGMEKPVTNSSPP